MANIYKVPDYFIKEIIAKTVKNDRRIIEAFIAVPRQLFVPPNFQHIAYEDRALPIGFGQTISQPSTVAHMLHNLEVTENDIVLEIGSGSGFLTALLSKLAKSVYAIELIPALFETSRKAIRQLGINNVRLRNGDGNQGWADYAPYTKIIASAAAKKLPAELINQLSDNGKIIIPVNDKLMTYKKSDGKVIATEGIGVNFVDFVGS